MSGDEEQRGGKCDGERISCPSCGSSKTYLLGDGRRSCGQCRKKFTPGPRKTRLPEDLHQEIIRQFWLMATAERASKILGVNRKTIQRHYFTLRALMAEENRRAFSRWMEDAGDQGSIDSSPTKGTSCPCILENLRVFCMFAHGQRVFVLFPHDLSEIRRHRLIPGHLPCAAIYAGSRESRKDLVLDDFHQQVPLSGKRDGAGILGHFWIFTKYRLKKYRGGVKRNFELFIREMEFRFNCQTEGKGYEWLVELHRGGTNT